MPSRPSSVSADAPPPKLVQPLPFRPCGPVAPAGPVAPGEPAGPAPPAEPAGPRAPSGPAGTSVAGGTRRARRTLPTGGAVHAVAGDCAGEELGVIQDAVVVVVEPGDGL